MTHLRFVFPFVLLACGQSKEEEEAIECDAPLSEAGDDQSIPVGMSATLDGAGSTWCEALGEPEFLWTFVSIPSDSSISEQALSDNRSSTAVTSQFLPDVSGEYVLSLKLDDGDQVSAEDYVVVSVLSTDAPPMSDCGGDYVGHIDEIVTLDASNSMDQENAPLEYAWSLTTPGCSELTSGDIYNEGGPSPSFVPDCDGVFVVGLVVSDGSQWSEPDMCSVDVASANRTPVADAGVSQEYGGCASSDLSLNGYGSYDLDGDDLLYSWSLVSVPSTSAVVDASIVAPFTAAPSFSWDVAGVYTFQLQVSDGSEWSAPDLVSLSIGEIAQNSRPIANAGDNQEIEVSADCESSSYSSDCGNCAQSVVTLNGSGSIDPNGDSLSFLWTEEGTSLGILAPGSPMTDVIIPSASLSSPTATINQTYQFSLMVSDCERSDDDSVTVTYSCTGN